MKIFKNTVLVLSTGYIFVYFSEHLFWTRVRPGDSLVGWIGTWIAYSLLAFVFLANLSYFRIRDLWMLFLAGSIFGWLAEGVIVQTTYEMLPLSISFTGLAWHALLTVWVGWYAVQKSFLSPDPFSTLKLAAAIGLASGLWAISIWLEPDGGVSTLPEYAGFSLITTLLVMLAYWLAHWSASEPFVPARWLTGFIAGLFVLYFILVAVPAAPLAALILPILLGLAYAGLARGRAAQTGDPLLARFSVSISITRILGLLALPAASTAFYALALSLHLRWQTNWVLYLITTPLGFILFGVSLYKTWRRSPRASNPPERLW